MMVPLRNPDRHPDHWGRVAADVFGEHWNRLIAAASTWDDYAVLVAGITKDVLKMPDATMRGIGGVWDDQQSSLRDIAYTRPWPTIVTRMVAEKIVPEMFDVEFFGETGIVCTGVNIGRELFSLMSLPANLEAVCPMDDVITYRIGGG